MKTVHIDLIQVLQSNTVAVCDVVYAEEGKLLP